MTNEQKIAAVKANIARNEARRDIEVAANDDFAIRQTEYVLDTLRAELRSLAK